MSLVTCHMSCVNNDQCGPEPVTAQNIHVYSLSKKAKICSSLSPQEHSPLQRINDGGYLPKPVTIINIHIYSLSKKANICSGLSPQEHSLLQRVNGGGYLPKPVTTSNGHLLIPKLIDPTLRVVKQDSCRLQRLSHFSRLSF